MEGVRREGERDGEGGFREGREGEWIREGRGKGGRR